MEQLAKQLARIRERADLLTTQLEQLPELAERLPPKLAARLAKRFRKLDVQERSGQLPVQYRHIADLIKQLPDQVEQVPPELVEQLAGQIAHYTEQLERLAEDVEQLTKQAKQLP
jgi:exonuclease VII large subunit